MPSIQVNHRQLFYAHRDRGSTHDLVFIHGAGGNHTLWGHQLAHVSQANTYALDLPGHGRSAGPGSHTIAGYRDAVLAFLDALGLQKVVLAGHSMGGGIAQAFALAYPDRVAGIILVGTGARLKVLPAILEGLLADFTATIHRVTNYSYGPATSPDVIRSGEQDLLKNQPAVIHGDFVACNDFDVMGQLGRIQVPTLILVGTEDRMTPVKFARYLESNIPGSELVLIEGAGHMLMLEKPEEVTVAINRFVTDRLLSQ